MLAFEHTRPAWPIHLVVVPKRHVAWLREVVGQMAAEVVAAHDGGRVATNLGHDQDSQHLHWHIGAGEPHKESP